MFFIFAKTTTIGSEICSPFLALKKLLLPLSHRVAWDEGCPIAAQANVWSRSSKKSGQTRSQPEITDKDLKKGFRELKGTDCSTGQKNQAEKKLILEERIPSRRYSWRRGYPAYSSDGEFVSEFHSCPLALRSGHSSKKNRAISSCGSTTCIKNGRSRIVIVEYPGDIFFVSTRLLLWLPRDLWLPERH